MEAFNLACYFAGVCGIKETALPFGNNNLKEQKTHGREETNLRSFFLR